jgi:integrase
VVDVRLHDLRRKAGSDLPLSEAQALLGHTDAAVTRRHYHVLADGVKPVK